MSRPMAVVGITAFLTLIFLGTVNVTVAVVLLSVFLVSSVVALSVKKIRKTVLIPVVCITVSAFCALFIATDTFIYKPVSKLTGNNVKIEGRVTDIPSAKDGKYVYTIKTTKINDQKVKTKVRFSTTKVPDLNPYDNVTFEGTVYVLGSGNEESHKYYKSKQMYLGAYTYKDVEVTTPDKKPILYYVIMLREKIKDSINKDVDNNIGGLINAMLLGDKSNISDKNYSNFKRIGVSHLIVVSGLHLTMWSSCAYIFLKKTKLPKRVAAILSSLFVLLFMALTGFSTSAVRAGIMVFVYYFGEILGEEPDSVNSLGLAVLIMCIINPFIAMDYGLMMSFFATLGILVLYPKLSNTFKKPVKRINQVHIRKILNGLLDIISVTLSANIFILPISVIYIGTLSLVSPLSNVLLVNAASLIMVCGGIAAIFSMIPIISFLKYPFLFISGILSKYFLKISDLLSEIPHASVSTDIGFVKICLAGIFLMLAATFIIKAVKGIDTIKYTAVLSVILAIVSVFSYQICNKDVMNIRVIDVGNGSAVAISKNGYSALLGCGGDYFASYNIKSMLNKSESNTLDFLLVPRATSTENSCAHDIVNNYNIDKVILSEDNEISKTKNIMLTNDAKITVFGDVTVEYINSDTVSAAFVKDRQSKILILFYPGASLSSLPDEWLTAQVLISRSGLPIDYGDYNFETVILSCDDMRADKIHKSLIKKKVNALATGGTGDIILSSRGNGTYKVRRGN